jgi:tRNA-(ms[2]io[6]A)-hydroxylase
VAETAEGVRLLWSTPPAWAEGVLAEPDALLSDHAHCELGAASTAQTLIARHPDLSPLVDALAALASEELRHFRRVHRLIRRRGSALAPVRRNAYAEGLVRAVNVERAAHPVRERLLDRLLVSALIERRSLERFELLAASPAAPPELARLYADLGPSEAGHATLFVDLATELFPGEDVGARLARWAVVEAELVRALPFAPAVHSGPPCAGAVEVAGAGPGVQSRDSTADRGGEGAGPDA